MTQALLPLQNSAIPGVERCEVEVPKSGVCPGSARLLDPQPDQRFEMGMVGESDHEPPKSKAEKIQEGLERTISDEAKQRIENVLNEVNQLSDVEKLLLYLKLPTGSALFSAKDGTAAPTSTPNRLETIQAATWIKSHLEEDVGTSLPKQEVFEDYRVYCESHGYKPLSQADFGKAMKCVFPNVKARRLGQRGQSKHCYGGLRKKLCVKVPMLPDLCHEETPVEPKKEEESSGCDELVLAASDLVCEWSQKLLNHKFGNLKDLAVYLIDNMYVSARSMAAFTVITSTGKGDAAAKQGATLGVSTTPSTSTLSRHRETQLQLQRKLQEREQIKEQKRKLEQQRSAMKSRGGDASDSRSADDSSRESEKGDCGGSISWSGSSLTTSVTMPKMMRQNENSRSKQQTPVTPPKVLLPKLGPTTTTTAHKPVLVNESASVTSAVTVNGSAAGPQQILVFSPTPHMSQPATQQLVILSPIGRGTASMQPTNIQQAMQPVIMSPINSQTRPHMTTQFAPKTVNVMQMPLLQTQVSNQGLANTVPVTTAIQSHTDLGISTARPNTRPELGSNCTEITSQLVSRGQFMPVTQTTSVPVLSQATDIAHWPQNNGDQTVTASNSMATQVTAHQQLQQQHSHQQHQIKQEQQQRQLQEHQLAGHLVGTAVVTSSTTVSKQTSAVLMDSPTPLKIVTTAASSPKSDNLQVSASNAVTKVTSKTVSDLLKEQRGYGNGSDSKMPYVNDRRPVSELLKDIRAKRLSTPVLAQALAPQTTLSPKMLGNGSPGSTPATVSIDHSPRMIAPLPIITSNVMATAQELTQISNNNNRSKPTSLQELLAKADHDLQTPTISPSTTERLRQVLVQSGVAKKRALTTSDLLPRKRPNLGAVSQDTIQKTAASIIRNPELANALMAVTPIQSKMELLKQELERQLATTRSNDQPAGFASRLAISLAKGGYISQGEMLKELQNQQKQTVVKNEFSKGENLSRQEKDALVDFFTSDPGPELADITPSITQIVQSPGVQNNQKLVQQSSIDKDDCSSNDSKSDGPYNLSEVLMKANTSHNPQIKKENSNSNHLMFQLITGRADPLQQAHLPQQAQVQQPVQPMSAPGSGHSTPCPSPGPSDPRQPYINLRGDVLLSQTATPKSAQITQWQRQLLLQNQQQQQQQQQHQHRQYHQKRQRHRSMPDQVLRQQISNINLTQPPNQQIQRQARAELFASSALLPRSSPGASPAALPTAPPQGTVMVTTMADGRTVQLQPQLMRSTSAQDMVMATVTQQQALRDAIQSNPALTAQLIRNNVVLNLATQVQQQHQNMQELQQQQVSHSGMTTNVTISGSNNNGMISLPQSPAQLMSPNSGSAQRSTASTPMSVLSPQTPMSHGMGQSRSIGPSPVEMTSHAFMPIQNLQLEGGGNVSLVRPTATIASTAAHSTVVNAMEQQLSVAESSSFQPYSTQPTQLAPVQTAVSFVTSDEKQGSPPSYNLVVRQRLAQKLGLHSAPNIGNGKETAHFAPASSIKPVKRGGRGTNKGVSGRRQRHHSAQSVLGGHHQTQSNTANLLRRCSLNQNQTESQPQQATTNTAVIGDVNMGLGPSTPESPFSPEIQDILNSASQGGGSNNMFRSQSVPVTDLFFDGDYSSSSDMFSAGPSGMDQQKESELMDDLGGDISSLANLLQGKLQEDGSSTSRGLHAPSGEGFVARRNLTELIEQRTSMRTQDASNTHMKNLQGGNPSFATISNTFDFDDNNSSQSLIGFRGRGDVTLTSASLCDNTQLRQMQGLSVVLPNTTSSSGLAAVVSQPSSTIDFSAEVQNIVGQTSNGVLQMSRLGLSGGSVGGAVSTLDTPSSMDTMSTQDSRDSLADSLFQTTYDATSDFSQNLGSAQSMDMVSSSDFTFPQWEMGGQLVHD